MPEKLNRRGSAGGKRQVVRRTAKWQILSANLSYRNLAGKN
jgi:hypothetical protein